MNSLRHTFTSGGQRIKATLATLAILLSVIFAPAPAEAKKSDMQVAVDTITAAQAFLRMPQQDLDLLSTSMRRDMLDYMEQRDSVYKKANVFMGLSWIEEMRPDYIKVHLSDVSNLVIKVLPDSKGGLPVVMSIYTIDDGNDTADSTVKFFSNSMQPLAAKKLMKMPDPTEFYNLPKDAPLSKRDLEQMLPFYTIAFSVSPDSDVMTGQLTSANLLSTEQSEQIKPYLHSKLIWRWDGRKMQLEKPE
jgi:hypothetical protein